MTGDNEFEVPHERVMLQEPGAMLELIFFPQLERLLVQIVVGDEHSLSLQGSIDPLIVGTTSQQGRLELVGPAAAVFWHKLRRRIV